VDLTDAVSDEEIDALKAKGWKGRPGDNREALYPPGDQLTAYRSEHKPKAERKAASDAKAAETATRKTEADARRKAADQAKADRDAEQAKLNAAELAIRQQEGEALAKGLMTEAEIRAARKKRTGG
jgi:hypothetical protein